MDSANAGLSNDAAAEPNADDKQNPEGAEPAEPTTHDDELGEVGGNADGAEQQPDSLAFEPFAESFGSDTQLDPAANVDPAANIDASSDDDASVENAEAAPADAVDEGGAESSGTLPADVRVSTEADTAAEPTGEPALAADAEAESPAADGFDASAPAAADADTSSPAADDAATSGAAEAAENSGAVGTDAPASGSETADAPAITNVDAVESNSAQGIVAAEGTEEISDASEIPPAAGVPQTSANGGPTGSPNLALGIDAEAGDPLESPAGVALTEATDTPASDNASTGSAPAEAPSDVQPMGYTTAPEPKEPAKDEIYNSPGAADLGVSGVVSGTPPQHPMPAERPCPINPMTGLPLHPEHLREQGLNADGSRDNAQGANKQSAAVAADGEAEREFDDEDNEALEALRYFVRHELSASKHKVTKSDKQLRALVSILRG